MLLVIMQYCCETQSVCTGKSLMAHPIIFVCCLGSGLRMTFAYSRFSLSTILTILYTYTNKDINYLLLAIAHAEHGEIPSLAKSSRHNSLSLSFFLHSSLLCALQVCLWHLLSSSDAPYPSRRRLKIGLKSNKKINLNKN